MDRRIEAAAANNLSYPSHLSHSSHSDVIECSVAEARRGRVNHGIIEHNRQRANEKREKGVNSGVNKANMWLRMSNLVQKGRKNKANLVGFAPGGGGDTAREGTAAVLRALIERAGNVPAGPQ